MIEVSIIIPVFDDKKAIQLTLDSLRNQSYSRDKFEIIIVDNGSKDGTFEWLKKQEDIVLLRENKFKNSPYSARNRGIEISKGHYIALLDATCIPDKKWVENGIKFFKTCNCDLFGGDVKFNFENKITAGKIYDSVTNIQMELSIKLKNAAKTANLWVKKSVFEKMGLFIEGVRSGEDLGWTSRITEQGYSLKFCNDCVVYKFARGAKELFKKQIRVGKGQVKLWYSQGQLNTMLKRSLRKLLPISPKSMKMLLSRTDNRSINIWLIFKIYIISYIAGLLTLYGNLLQYKEIRSKGEL